jgi:ferredoxin
MAISKKIVLKFPARLVEKPIVSRLIKDYDLEFSILRASVAPDEEGLLVLELRGERQNYKDGIDYLKKTGVEIQPLSKDVTRNENRCTDCGACIISCPTDAFEVDPRTKKVKFITEKCIACELCIKICPPRAMELHF